MFAVFVPPGRKHVALLHPSRGPHPESEAPTLGGAYVFSEFFSFGGEDEARYTRIRETPRQGHLRRKNAGEKLLEMNYDIHVGAIGGMPGKILAFFASLLSASLPVTGFLIWYPRWRRRGRRKQRGSRPTESDTALPDEVGDGAAPKKNVRPIAADLPRPGGD